MTMTRRDAIGLLGAGAGVGLASRLGLLAQSGPVIRTLLKDVAPAAIDGPILFHEHLSIRTQTKAMAAGPRAGLFRVIFSATRRSG